MQTILGAGGGIGTDLAKELTSFTDTIRLVGRNPKKINENDFLLKADLTNKEDVFKAVEGSEICYLTVGLKYSSKVWQRDWPILMDNVIAACKEHNSKLIFFDNVYSLGVESMGNITEESPMNPCSRKGIVRAEVERKILSAVEKGEINAIIARAPDFFGPIKENSVLNIMVYDNLAKGKKAQWLCNAKVPHTFGFTPDLAKGTAMLGNAADAYNQIWNLPVPKNTLTGEEWINLFAEKMNVPAKYMVMPKWAVSALGVFVPVMKEIAEMTYQSDRPYVFNSSKFDKRFNLKLTGLRAGVERTIEFMHDVGK